MCRAASQQSQSIQQDYSLIDARPPKTTTPNISHTSKLPSHHPTMCVTEVVSKFCPTCNRKLHETRSKHPCGELWNRRQYGTCSVGETFRTTSRRHINECTECRAEARRKDREQREEDKLRRREERRRREDARRDRRRRGS